MQPRMAGTRPNQVWYLHQISSGKQNKDLLLDQSLSGIVSTKHGLSVTQQTDGNTTYQRFAYIIWGAGGTGKTTAARSLCSILKDMWGWKAYYKDGSKWWPNYDGQEIVVFNEFEGVKDGLTLLNFKLLIDKCPISHQYKGGSIPTRVPVVLFLSNVDPLYWYQDEYKEQGYSKNYIHDGHDSPPPFQPPKEYLRRIKRSFHYGEGIDRYQEVVHEPSLENRTSKDPVIRTFAQDLYKEQHKLVYKMAVLISLDIEHDEATAASRSDEERNLIYQLDDKDKAYFPHNPLEIFLQ